MSLLTENIQAGVPIEAPIIIRGSDICGVCDDKDTVEKTLLEEHKKLLDFIGTLGTIQNIYMYATTEVRTDSETLEKKIIFSPTLLINSIASNLNINLKNKQEIDSNLVDIEKFENLYHKKMKLLRRVRKPKELAKEFPVLYKQYQVRQKQYQEVLQKFIPVLQMKKDFHAAGFEIVLKQYLKEIGITDINEFIRNQGKVSTAGFCEICAQGLETIKNNMPEIVKYMFAHPLNIEDKLSTNDQEKLSLFIASQYLLAAKTYGQEDIQKYLLYMVHYFRETPDRKTNDELQITIGNVQNERTGVTEQGFSITPKQLYEQYKEIAVNYPELRLLNFDDVDFSTFNLQEAEEFINLMLEDIKVNWDIIPEEKLDERVISEVKIEKRNSLKSEEEQREHQEKLVNLYMEKKEFYDSTDPFYRIAGKNTFNGYIGHIYTNGKVILDKFFENADTGRVADGQAIYVMNFEDFARLSALPKSELIQNPACRRIIHAGDWQSRVQNEINSETMNKPGVELQKLQQKGKIVKQ